MTSAETLTSLFSNALLYDFWQCSITLHKIPLPKLLTLISILCSIELNNQNWNEIKTNILDNGVKCLTILMKGMEIKEMFKGNERRQAK